MSDHGKPGQEPKARPLTIRRHGAAKGGALEFMCIDVSPTATVDQLCKRVLEDWLIEGRRLDQECSPGCARWGSERPEWLTGSVEEAKELWQVIVLQRGSKIAPSLRLEDCANDLWDANTFWGDHANSMDFEHYGVACLIVPKT